MLRGHEAFSFQFYKPSSLKFWVLGELASPNFWFWVVFLWSSLWTWNQNSFKFPAFLELTNSDITSFFFSDNYWTIFPTPLRLWWIKNSDFNIPISPQCFVQFVLNFRICLFYTYWTHWTQTKKMSKFWFIWPLRCCYIWKSAYLMFICSAQIIIVPDNQS